MQYLRFLLLMALLVFSAALTSGAVSARTQPVDPLTALQSCNVGGLNEGPEGKGEWWTAVCKPVPLDVPDQVQIFGTLGLRPYAVKFAEEHGAARPVENAEFMVVVVTQGQFALDVESSDAVAVSSPAGSLTLLQRLPDQEPYYQELSDKMPCAVTCTIDPQQPVLLVEGDVAIAKQGALCLWCLLHANQGLVGSGGVLQVLVQLDPNQTDNPASFSWIQDWEKFQPEGQADSTVNSSMVMAWAYNPQSSRCHGG